MNIRTFSMLRYKMVMVPLLLFYMSCEKDSPTSEEVPKEEVEMDPTEITARTDAKEFYETHYEASRSSTGDVAWTGDEPSCNPGSVPQATIDKILLRLAYFRKAVGLNNTIEENPTKSEKAQQAALMMLANGVLEHFPPDNWKCFSSAGKEGAGNSLLTTARNAEAVDSYIKDNGDFNGPVGHRRWLLWPNLQEIGIGNTANANAIWVLGNAGAPPEDAPEYIAWPPKGYVPKQVVYPRWSFSIAGADFTGTQVSMKDASGESMALQIEELDNGFGDRTIVWVPQGINTGANEDVSYTVTLNNVEVDGDMKDYEYTVVLFDANE